MVLPASAGLILLAGTAAGEAANCITRIRGFDSDGV